MSVYQLLLQTQNSDWDVNGIILNLRALNSVAYVC
jgi:hypothetical protein